MEHAAAICHVYEPEAFARGEKVMLWPGRFDASNRKTVRECIENYPRLSEPIAEITRLMRFFVAPLACEERIRRRSEAAIALALYAAPDPAGSFQEKGIRYRPRTAVEAPLECLISSPVPLLGLPGRIQA